MNDKTMGIFNRFSLTTALLMFAAFGAFAQQTPEYKVGIAYGNSLMSTNDRFEFSLGGNKKIVVDSANLTVYFTDKFRSGQNYTITQTSGPRTCNFFNQSTGKITNQDVLITVNCGFPPTSIFKINVTGVEQGETFKFADNYKRTFSTPFSTIANLGGFPIGDNYSVLQTAGPRQCKMSNNLGTAPNTPLTIQADCRKLPAGNIPQSTLPSFELVSRSFDDKKFGTFYDSTSPTIGGIGVDEGRYVAFVSYAVGLGGSTGKNRQIIWRDRKTGETIVISHSESGGEGNQNSFAPVISADGLSVAFESYATNLVPIDTNKVRDIFVWNYRTRMITAVSDAPGGIEANSECFEPTISGDGNLIAFSSSASTLTSGVDGTSTVNVFLKDMRSGAVTLISVDPKTKKGGGGSRPSISADGSRIAFYNYFPLTEDDKNNIWDIYIWDRSNPKLKRVSLTANGVERNQGDESSSRVVSPTISGDGRFVTFSTTATNMVTGDAAKFQDAFRVEIATGSLVLLSAVNGSFGNGDTPIGQGETIPISYDGTRVIFTTKAANLGGSLVIQNLIEGNNLQVVVTKENSAGGLAISRNGNCVAFGSNARLDKRFPSSGIFVTCRE